MSKPAKSFDPPWHDGWTPSVLFGVALAAFHAFWQLLGARLRFSRLRAADIEGLNAHASATGKDPATDHERDRRRLALVAALIPRVGYRLPWRSDCLIQAMAAQQWLLSYGIASRIAIGVDKDTEEGFMSHAWLVHGEYLICGGDIERFTVVFGEIGNKPDR